MKKALFLTVALAFVMMAGSTYAAEMPRSVDKLVKGTTEVLISPMVFLDHTKAEIDKAEFKGVGLMKGLIESPFYVVKKAGGGLLKIVTFPIK